MTESTETVLERIGRGTLRALKGIIVGVGYVFYGIGMGLGWTGQMLGKLGGKACIGAHKNARNGSEVRTGQCGQRVVPDVALKDQRKIEETTGRDLEPEKASEIDIPTSKAEILAVIEGAPYKVFPKNERRLMEGVLTLRERPVRELMIPKDKIIYVDNSELLGPMTLDRLYRSKLRHFPVKNPKGEVIGAVHTSSLNSLEVKESFRAGEILDSNVYYIRDDYTMAEALDAFLRNDCYFCLVVNGYGKVVGMVNLDDLAQEIFGEMEVDDFKRDNDPLAVAKRHFPVEIE